MIMPLITLFSKENKGVPNLKIYCKKTRALIAWMLLCAMLLAGCGSAAPAEETPPPEETAAPTPTPEPTPEPFVTEVVLSELQASNKATLPDADGDFCDWIELYNPGAEACDLSGCWLSDSEKDPCRWQIPSLTIDGGAYAVIFCSKKDRGGDELHASFALSSQGDELILSSPAGEPIWKIGYDGCGADCSLCFEGESVRSTVYPTPGWPNTEEGYELFAEANDRHGALVVNEAVTYNEDYMFHALDYYDWVELKNVSDKTIVLSDYYVSDDPDERTLFRLSDDTLEPGEICVVYCGEAGAETAVCHTPFKLDSKGEGFYIYRADGTLSDYISLYNLPLNHSKGRKSGESGFFLFSKRTPDEANRGGARFITARPESVTPPGIYDDLTSLDVELSAEGTIYYTLDGREPTRDSEVYTGPIHLGGTTQIRAVAEADGKLMSEIATYTYLLDEHHTLPVVCVTLDPQKLNILYYNNGNMEYDSHAEYYGPEGSFDSDCMITLHGAASRSVWDKKSFKIVFRDRYGGDISFDLFGQGITEFHSLNLRGGDSVGMLTYREPLSAEFAERVAVTEPFCLDSRFCILYLNGEYWGIYTLREAYSRKYVASHTGSDEDLVSISRAPVKSKYQPELYDLFMFATYKDMTDPDNYNYVADRLDLENFAQWICLETYFNNYDPTGNVRYALGNQPDGKWRTMFFDLDQSLMNEDASIFEALGMGHKPSQIGFMLCSLLKNENFRELFLHTAAGLYENGLRHELLVEIFDRMVEELAPEMPRNLERWGESPSLYENNVEWQRRMMGQYRDDRFQVFIQAYSEASDAEMEELFPPRS